MGTPEYSYTLAFPAIHCTMVSQKTRENNEKEKERKKKTKRLVHLKACLPLPNDPNTETPTANQQRKEKKEKRERGKEGKKEGRKGKKEGKREREKERTSGLIQTDYNNSPRLHLPC